MAKRHAVFRWVMRHDAPNFLKAHYLGTANFSDTKKICGYCEAHRLYRLTKGTELPTDQERTWHLRSTLIRLPNGLFMCRRHPGPKARALDAIAHLVDA